MSVRNLKEKDRREGREKRPGSLDFIIPRGSFSPVCFAISRSIIKTKKRCLPHSKYHDGEDNE